MSTAEPYFAITNPNLLFHDTFLQDYDTPASDTLGDMWNMAMMAGAVDSDDIYYDVNETDWLNKNVKRKYRPLFRVLVSGAINYDKFRQEIAKDKDDDYYMDVKEWYEEAKEVMFTGNYELESPWTDNEHVAEWFYDIPYTGEHLNNVAIVLITSKLFAFLVENGFIEKTIEDLSRLLTSYEILWRKLHVNVVDYSHAFIRMLATPTDYGYIVLNGGNNIEPKSVGIKKEWLGSLTMDDVLIVDEYAFLLTAKKNPSPRLFNFNDNGIITFTINPIFNIDDYAIIEKIKGYPVVTTRKPALSVYHSMVKGKYRFIVALPKIYTGYETNVAMETIQDDTFVLVYSNIQKATPFVIDDIRLSIGTTEGDLFTLRLQDADGNDIVLNEVLARDINLAIYHRIKEAGYNSGKYNDILKPLTLSAMADKINEMESRELTAEEQDIYKALTHIYTLRNMKRVVDDLTMLGSQAKLLAKANRDKAIELYTDLVSMGLYFRRWKGPGHPFPYSKESTMDTTVNPDVNARPLITKYTDIIFDPDNIIAKLVALTPRYGDSNGAALANTFMPMFTAVLRSQECIRVASKSFIFTGHRFLSILGVEYTVNGDTFDPDLLDINMELLSPEEVIQNLTRLLDYTIRTSNDPASIRRIEDQLALLIPNYVRRLP